MSKQILIPSNKYHFHSKFPRIFIQKSRKIAVFEPLLEKIHSKMKFQSIMNEIRSFWLEKSQNFHSKTLKIQFSINFWTEYTHFDRKEESKEIIFGRSDAVTGHLKPFEAGCFLCSGFILFVNMAKWYNLSPVLPLSIPNSADHISLVTFRISFYTFNL